MAQTKNFNINVELIDDTINEFVESQEKKITVEKVIQKVDSQWVFKFKVDGQKRYCTNLTCYFKKAGVSFLVQGKDINLGNECKEYLIENASVTLRNRKAFTIQKAEEEQVDVVMEFLREVCECEITEKECGSCSVLKQWKVEGKYHDCIHVTFYTNGTFLVQGRPNITFLNFIDIATQVFTPSEIKREHLKMYDVTDTEEAISANLKNHLPNAYKYIDEKLDAIMAPSLALLNSDIVLTDYSAMAFPILRGAEGVLKDHFSVQGVDLGTNGFGEFFRFDRNKACIIWEKDRSGLFPKSNYRESLLDLYSFFHRQRHTIFHAETQVALSRTLEFNEAFDMVKEGLSLIDKTYQSQ